MISGPGRASLGLEDRVRSRPPDSLPLAGLVGGLDTITGSPAGDSVDVNAGIEDAVMWRW